MSRGITRIAHVLIIYGASSFNDPRMIQVLGVLMGIDMSATTREEGSNDMPPGFGASQPGPSSPPPQPSAKSAAPQAPQHTEDVKMDDPEPEDEDAKEAKRLKAEAEAEKKKGAEAYKRRDFTVAEEAFKKAWEISPTDITFLTNLAGEQPVLAVVCCAPVYPANHSVLFRARRIRQMYRDLREGSGGGAKRELNVC